MVGLFVLSGILVGISSSPRASSEGNPASAPLATSADGRTITLYPDEGSAAVFPYVNLTGFPSDGQATVDVYNPSVPSFDILSDPFFYMNSSGEVNQTASPSFFASAGTYVYSANETGSANVTADYTNSPGNITLSADPSTVEAGGSTDLLGSGNELPGGQEYTVYIGSVSFHYEDIGSGYTSADLSQSVTIPSGLPAGSYVVFFQDDYEDYGATTITVTSAPATLALSPTNGNPGTPVAASGSGLADSVSFNLFFGDIATPVCSGTTTGDGTYSCDFNVPAYSAGTVTAEAVDADSNSASANFQVLLMPTEDLATNQKAEYFLSLPSGDLPSYDYKVDGTRGLLIQSWRLVTVNPPDAAKGSNSRNAYFPEPYVYLTMEFTPDANIFFKDYAKGSDLPTLNIQGYTNYQGEALRFLNLIFANVDINWESVYAVNGTPPQMALNFTFEKITIETQKSQIGQGTEYTNAGEDEYNVGAASTDSPVGLDSSDGSNGYLMTSSLTHGGLTEAKKDGGTEIYTWSWASDWVNLTLLWSGGATLWLTTGSHISWLNILYWKLVGDYGHQEFTWDFTNVDPESVTLIGHDGYVPYALVSAEFGGLIQKVLTT